jgi:hypothetical protein
MTSNVPAPTAIATAIARLPTTVSIGYLDNIRNPNLKSSQDSPMRISLSGAVAPSLHDEMQSERHRLPPVAASRARQTVLPAIALEDFVQIASDRLAHVGRQRVSQ